MKTEDYPKLTVIMRGYSYEEAMIIFEILTEFNKQVAVEVTTNNPDYLKIIHDGNEKFGHNLFIGAGTVLTFNQAKEVIQAGAQFMLAPNEFSEEIIELAKENHVLTVPAAFTPTEIKKMFDLGADIVKVFPASTVGANYFKQLQGPYGTRNLMAVGGISLNNASDFYKNGANYLGVGSSMFDKLDIKNGNIDSIKLSIQNYLSALEREDE